VYDRDNDMMTTTTTAINKKSPVAAYMQLKDIIYRQIKEGEFKPHDMMPSERALQKIRYQQDNRQISPPETNR